MITTKPIDYNKVEASTDDSTEKSSTDDSTKKPSTTDTSDNNYSSIFYPGTIIYDYTYVTGISQKNPPYFDGESVIYNYPYTMTGEYPEAVDYMLFLKKNGWTDYDYEKDGINRRWYLQKGNDMILVSYHGKYDEVCILFLLK